MLLEVFVHSGRGGRCRVRGRWLLAGIKLRILRDGVGLCGIVGGHLSVQLGRMLRWCWDRKAMLIAEASQTQLLSERRRYVCATKRQNSVAEMVEGYRWPGLNVVGDENRVGGSVTLRTTDAPESQLIGTENDLKREEAKSG